MKKIIHSFKYFKNLIFNKKYRVYWIITIVIIGIIWFVFFRNGDKTETLVVHPGEFLQQVAVSGKIIATEMVDLSFEQSGQVKGVYVKEGDSIKHGQLLSSQDISQLNAQLAETRAGIQLQEARRDQLLAGKSPEDISVAENEVISAKQDLNDAYENSLVILDDAYTAISTSNNTITYIRNTYFSAFDQIGIKVQESRLKIQNYLSDSKNYVDKAKLNPDDSNILQAINKMISALNGVYEQLGIIRAQCEEGTYYLTVSSTDKTSLDTRKTEINIALTDVKSSSQDISGYKIALQQEQNELAALVAMPRQADINVYQAQIEQAKASEQNILAQLRKRQIYSPINGLVAKVNAKLGSIFAANDSAISIISSDPLLIESYMPEIYIPLVRVGNLATITLDAYGTEVFFEAEIISIDPTETLRDGVSTYRSKLQFITKDDRIRSGMTSNVIVTTEKKENVISVPRGIVISRAGKKFIKVQVGKEVIEKEVKTGIVSSLGNIEISSGLQDGDMVIIK